MELQKEGGRSPGRDLRFRHHRACDPDHPWPVTQTRDQGLSGGVRRLGDMQQKKTNRHQTVGAEKRRPEEQKHPEHAGDEREDEEARTGHGKPIGQKDSRDGGENQADERLARRNREFHGRMD